MSKTPYEELVSHSKGHDERHVASDMAKLSDISYDPKDESRNRRALELGYFYDPSESSRNRMVVRDVDGKSYIIYRGTASLLDVGSDLKIAAGYDPARYNRELEFAQDYAQRHGIDPKSLTFGGHSLGGGTARYVGEHIGDGSRTNTYIFNAAPGWHENEPEVAEYRHKGDIVSAFSDAYDPNVITVGSDDKHKGILSSHSLANLISDIPSEDMERGRSLSRNTETPARRTRSGSRLHPRKGRGLLLDEGLDDQIRRNNAWRALRSSVLIDHRLKQSRPLRKLMSRAYGGQPGTYMIYQPEQNTHILSGTRAQMMNQPVLRYSVGSTAPGVVNFGGTPTHMRVGANPRFISHKRIYRKR